MKYSMSLAKVPKTIEISLIVLFGGSCAIVYKARYKKTHEIRALKCSDSKKPPEKKAQSEKLLENEGQLLSRLSNDRIVKLFETISTPDERILIMEYCEGGRLFDALKKSKALVNERIVCSLMEQLLEGVAYLHSKRIIHRDLKMENILLETDNLEVGLIKLIDFGISVEMTDQGKLNKVVGSSSYMAPELVRGRYDEKIDEWACGMIMYILLTGLMPYKSKDFAQTRELILTKEINFDESALSTLSPEGKKVMKQLLERDSEKRISARDVLESKWIKNNQVSRINSLDELRLRSIDGVDFDDSELRALLEILMIGVFCKKIEDRKEVSAIFRKIDRKSQQEISVGDLVIGIIGKAVEERMIRLRELKLIVEDERIFIERRVLLNLICKLAFGDDIQMKGVLLGYIHAKEYQKDLDSYLDHMLAKFEINKQKFHRYFSSKEKLSLDMFYDIQLGFFVQ